MVRGLDSGREWSAGAGGWGQGHCAVRGGGGWGLGQPAEAGKKERFNTSHSLVSIPTDTCFSILPNSL